MKHMNRRSFLGVGAGSLAVATFGRAASLPSLLAQGSQGRPAADIVADTATGKIRGSILTGVRMFKGVPYGASTAGQNRFMPSTRPMPWAGVRDALEFGPRSPQPVRQMVPEMGDTLTGSGPMSEDCLRLNVWTPATGAGRRPVMVWLHGGGFRTGSGNAVMFDGHGLARKHDVVVVTVTHRLNVLGFLYLGELAGGKYADSTNLGMRDIVLALEWVRDNIAGFGGDAGNVTVFGQSGGGGETSMLTAWPSARGLFHRAIIQSTLSDTAVRGLSKDAATQAAQTFLTRLGVKPDQPNQLDALQNMPIERLMEALVGGTGPAGETARDVRPGAAQPVAADLSLRFTPVVDGKWLPRHPYDPDAPAVSADIPVLCGSVETESVPYQGVNDPYWTTTEIDAATLRDRVKRSLQVEDADADRVIAIYRKHRPKASNMDLATIVASDNGVLRTSVDDRRAQDRAGEGAGLHVLLQLVFAAARRPSACDALYRSAVCLRPCGRGGVHDRSRSRTSSARGQDERGVGGVRADRKSKPCGLAQVACVQSDRAPHDGVQQRVRARQRSVRRGAPRPQGPPRTIRFTVPTR